MRGLIVCKICKKEFQGKANRFYCEKCREALYKYGAYRYKITPTVFVWVKGTIKRCVVDGKDVIPVHQAYEVVD